MSKSLKRELANHSAPPPDHYTRLSAYLTPDESLVISRGLDGSVVSLFKDNIWDVRMYDARNKCVYNFADFSERPDEELKRQIIHEMKIVQLARQYLAGYPRKVNSIKIVYLRKLAVLALNNDVSLTELLNDQRSHVWIVSSFSNLTPSSMKPALALLRELFAIRANHPDFKIAPSNYDLLVGLERIFNRFPKPKFNAPLQTKLIPSRIYSSLIISFGETLDNFNNYSSAICKFYELRAADPLFAVSNNQSTKYFRSTSWAEAARRCGLEALFEKFRISKWKELETYTGKVQIAAKYWIHLFSGMRDNEAIFLPADSYASIDAGDSSFKILQGFTSKIGVRNHSATFWVTHKIVERGIDAAVALGRVAAVRCGWNDENKSQYPLFAGRVARKKKSGSANKNTWHFEHAPVAGSINERTQKALLSESSALRITEEDIRELEMFDGFRNWRNDPNMEIGKLWPLTTHQCRRSLAVYGARSGMLSLGSSALQFKQLTEAMASYYRKDSAFAVNFLQTEDAQKWIDELECERRVAQFIQYEDSVINTTGRLWGGEGNRIQVARDKGTPLIITTDRAVTQKKFANGEMVFKPSPIGGCTNLDHCDMISFTSIFACLDCEKAILDDHHSLKKINRGLNNLKREQALFLPENPLHGQLNSEILSLYEKLDKRGLREKMESLI